MIGFREAKAWAIDYLFVAFWQVRHLRGRRPPARWGTGIRQPVVLLPGVYETWQFLRPIGDRLNEAGHPVHVVRDLGYNRAEVPATAALVARSLREGDLNRVLLVAHSKGGLVGKHLMALDDPELRVDRLIAINTPFAGSKYARYLPLRTVRAFLPTAPTLAMLAADLATNTRITSIYSEFDPHIPGGSMLEGARNIRLELLGHFRPLSHPVLIDTVLAQVEEDSAA